MTQQDENLGCYYRYWDELEQYGWNDLLSGYPPQVKIKLVEYPILRKTPKGAWIRDYSYYRGNQKRLILDTWSNKFAQPTIIAARIDFIKRKQNQVKILEDQLARAMQAYHLACSQFEMTPKIPQTKTFNHVYDLEGYTPKEFLQDELPFP